MSGSGWCRDGKLNDRKPEARGGEGVTVQGKKRTRTDRKEGGKVETINFSSDWSRVALKILMPGGENGLKMGK